VLYLKPNCCGSTGQTPWRRWGGTNGKGKISLFSLFTNVLTILQGLGIALVAAQKAGVPVALVDTSQASIDKGLKFAGAVYQPSFKAWS